MSDDLTLDAGDGNRVPFADVQPLLADYVARVLKRVDEIDDEDVHERIRDGVDRIVDSARAPLPGELVLQGLQAKKAAQALVLAFSREWIAALRMEDEN